MIKPTINENDEIELNGEMAKGDIVPNRCCAGHNWTVSLIFDDPNSFYVDVWGFCDNPDCPDYDKNIGPDDFYRGVSHIEVEDLALWMIEEEKTVNQPYQPYQQPVESHTERIICPMCESIQDATVDHTWPWHSRVHDCQKCGYLIMESEWQKVEEPQAV